MFPGITPAVVKAILQTKGLRAVILETFGAGNAITQSWFHEALEKAVGKGIIILNITQCNAGRVEQGKYETSAALEKIGVIGGSDLTTEAAVTKLMFLLGSYSNPTTIKKLLPKSLRGELTE
jgi:L-asparaginase